MGPSGWGFSIFPCLWSGGCQFGSWKDQLQMGLGYLFMVSQPNSCDLKQNSYSPRPSWNWPFPWTLSQTMTGKHRYVHTYIHKRCFFLLVLPRTLRSREIYRCLQKSAWHLAHVPGPVSHPSTNRAHCYLTSVIIWGNWYFQVDIYTCAFQIELFICRGFQPTNRSIPFTNCSLLFSLRFYLPP